VEDCAGRDGAPLDPAAALATGACEAPEVALSGANAKGDVAAVDRGAAGDAGAGGAVADWRDVAAPEAAKFAASAGGGSAVEGATPASAGAPADRAAEATSDPGAAAAAAAEAGALKGVGDTAAVG
jgi:hypothetical protein